MQGEPSSDETVQDPPCHADDEALESGLVIETNTNNSIPDEEDHGISSSDSTSMNLYMAANQIILGEIGQQHDETLSSIGHLTQRSGIVMAFDSVLIIELFEVNPGVGFVWCTTALSIPIGMMLGLATIVTGRMAPLGAGIKIVKSTYENGMYKELTPIIFNEKQNALKQLVKAEYRISNMVLLQAVCLMIGVLGLMILEM